MSSFRKLSQQENTEVNSLLNELMGVNVQNSNESTPTSTRQNSAIENYQLPVRVGKDGKSIDEGDHPWIVGTFLPKQYVNETHPQGHEGVDLKALKGTPVYPIASGIVKEIGAGAVKSGNYVSCLHEDGHVQSFYAHLDSIKVSKGQQINQSTVIGTVGASGNARGVFHLHFQVSIDGKNIDPMSIINKQVGSLSLINKKAEIYKEMLNILTAIVED